jgi:hypothetical protein
LITSAFVYRQGKKLSTGMDLEFPWGQARRIRRKSALANPRKGRKLGLGVKDKGIKFKGIAPWVRYCPSSKPFNGIAFSFNGKNS